MSYTDKATNQQPFSIRKGTAFNSPKQLIKTQGIFTNRFVGFGRDQIVICNLSGLSSIWSGPDPANAGYCKAKKTFGFERSAFGVIDFFKETMRRGYSI